MTWPMQQVMDQAWGLDGAPGQDLLVPQAGQLVPSSLGPQTWRMSTGVVLGCDHGQAPFPVSVPRLELAALLRKLDMMSEHRPEIWRPR